MSHINERWAAVDGSVYTEAVHERAAPAGRIYYRPSIAFNVGQMVAEHMVRLHNASLHAQPAQRLDLLRDESISAVVTLKALGYTYHGGEQWKPPLGGRGANATPTPHYVGGDFSAKDLLGAARAAAASHDAVAAGARAAPPPHDSLEEAQRAAGLQGVLDHAPTRDLAAALLRRGYKSRVHPLSHYVRLVEGDGYRVGQVVVGDEGMMAYPAWAPCDKDGWVELGVAVGVHVQHIEFRQPGNQWRPLPTRRGTQGETQRAVGGVELDLHLGTKKEADLVGALYKASAAPVSAPGMSSVMQVQGSSLRPVEIGQAVVASEPAPKPCCGCRKA